MVSLKFEENLSVQPTGRKIEIAGIKHYINLQSIYNPDQLSNQIDIFFQSIALGSGIDQRFLASANNKVKEIISNEEFKPLYPLIYLSELQGEKNIKVSEQALLRILQEQFEEDFYRVAPEDRDSIPLLTIGSLLPIDPALLDRHIYKSDFQTQFLEKQEKNAAHGISLFKLNMPYLGQTRPSSAVVFQEDEGVKVSRTASRKIDSIVEDQYDLEVPLDNGSKLLVSDASLNISDQQVIKQLLKVGYAIHGNTAAELKSNSEIEVGTLPLLIRIQNENGEVMPLLTINVKMESRSSKVIDNPSGLDLVSNMETLIGSSRNSDDIYFEFGNLTMLDKDGNPGLYDRRTAEIAFYVVAYMAYNWAQTKLPRNDMSKVKFLAIVKDKVSKLLCNILNVPLELKATKNNVILDPAYKHYFNRTSPYWFGVPEDEEVPKNAIPDVAVIANDFESFKRLTDEFFINISKQESILVES